MNDFKGHRRGEGLRAGNAENNANGQAVGFLPGSDPRSGNEYLTLTRGGSPPAADPDAG